ncbi:MAG: helix-turn-helix transcriptional regulator [Tannerella sp.]|jgi:transcriptional regulator with XRE-family HTH domain|nr:helix-turn-helix transcriptional regulator [Tannerella sp.]
MVDFDFSGRIKAILKDLGLNQTAFASKMNLSQGVVSEFASGARLPSKEFIFGLSKLGISLDWFLTGVGDYTSTFSLGFYEVGTGKTGRGL